MSGSDFTSDVSSCFRLSPLVSGSVYLAYDVLVFEVVPRDGDEQREYLNNKNWPNSWRDSKAGR